MARSAYAVTSALIVACPECYANKGEACWSFGDITSAPRQLKRSHSARRRLADEQRTREVQEVMEFNAWLFETMVGAEIERANLDKHPPYCPCAACAIGENEAAERDADPPSYLPTREPLPPRIPDLCPDEAKDEPHNPETCTNPTCDCYPF